MEVSDGDGRGRQCEAAGQAGDGVRAKTIYSLWCEAARVESLEKKFFRFPQTKNCIPRERPGGSASSDWKPLREFLRDIKN